MHSYLKTVGFSQITRRSEIKEIISDVIASYDEKVCVENHPEGVFVQFSKNYGCDCGISVCGQYDENGDFTWNIISHFSGEQESHPRKK